MNNLKALNKQIMLCRNCILAESRTNVVPGTGPDNAQAMFIGIAPEDVAELVREPLSPRTYSGEILMRWLSEIGLSPQEVYLTNILKCNPDRKPMKFRLPYFDEGVFSVEIKACREWLIQEIVLLQPKVVVTLGAPPLHQFFPGVSVGSFEPRGRMHQGRMHFALFHPRNVGQADWPEHKERLKELRCFLQQLQAKEGTNTQS